ncbi:MAG TPA: superoxide dismutase [Anaerolineae bacterium]|nr:superoxide dismutase [Anaerolineae bacterium]
MRHVSLFGLLFLLYAVLIQSVNPIAVSAAPAFPKIISLPNGFQPEGLTAGPGTTAYTGSVATGAIYQVNLRTGVGSILVPAQSGRAALGLAFDPRTRYLYVAGGPTGNAYIYDSETGAMVQTLSLAPSGSTFINDVVITRDAAYFTDSSRPFIYRVALSAGGRLSNPAQVQVLPLTGDFQFVSGQFNANGIEATPNGKWLIIVNTFVGALYRVNPATGEATQINVDSLPNGDGILLLGHTLYVVQNFTNQVAVVKLNPSFTSGQITNVITDPALDVPTSIDHHGSAIYVVNARFNTPPTPATSYTIVKLP